MSRLNLFHTVVLLFNLIICISLILLTRFTVLPEFSKLIDGLNAFSSLTEHFSNNAKVLGIFQVQLNAVGINFLGSLNEHLVIQYSFVSSQIDLLCLL